LQKNTRPFFYLWRCSWSLWKKICRQSHKYFSGKFVKIRAKILRTSKICLLLHLCCKPMNGDLLVSILKFLIVLLWRFFSHYRKGWLDLTAPWNYSKVSLHSSRTRSSIQDIFEYLAVVRIQLCNVCFQEKHFLSNNPMHLELLHHSLLPLRANFAHSHTQKNKCSATIQTISGSRMFIYISAQLLLKHFIGFCSFWMFDSWLKTNTDEIDFNVCGCN